MMTRSGAASWSPADSSAVAASLPVALGHLIDYAGLFPPAGLDMAAAVENYAKYKVSEHGWMLGRFIVPLPKLEEFRSAFSPVKMQDPYKLSVLMENAGPLELGKIELFNRENAPDVVADVAEAKPLDRAGSPEGVRPRSEKLTVYREIPLNTTRDVLVSMGNEGVRAKIRSGGVVPDAIPAAADVARFLTECAAARLAFKATAGLHHPIRCIRPLTYEAGAVSGKMHGFLNVLLAAALAWRGVSFATVEEALAEEDAETISFGEAGLHWRETAASTEMLKVVRERFFISFGSCSFEEPVADLKQMGWL